MRRLLLSPRWWVGHVLAVACFVACLWLGWWQWGRANAAGGTAQNLGYALQWPLFAFFALFGWWKVLRLEVMRREADSAAGHPAAGAGAPALRPSVVPRIAPPAYDYGDDEADEELAAYNRHLAWLHEQHQQRSR